MKSLMLISALSLLVSCGGGGDKGAPAGTTKSAACMGGSTSNGLCVEFQADSDSYLEMTTPQFRQKLSDESGAEMTLQPNGCDKNEYVGSPCTQYVYDGGGSGTLKYYLYSQSYTSDDVSQFCNNVDTSICSSGLEGMLNR